jgi:hydrogenase maturation factor
MCLGEIGTVAALDDEAGPPVARVRAPDGAERRCGVFAPGVEVGSAVLVHLGYVVEVLDPERAAQAVALRRTTTFPEGSP